MCVCVWVGGCMLVRCREALEESAATAQRELDQLLQDKTSSHDKVSLPPSLSSC